MEYEIKFGTLVLLDNNDDPAVVLNPRPGVDGTFSAAGVHL